MMPVMSGWEFLERQQKDPDLRGLPVFVMTASGLVGDIKAKALIRKPIDFGVLMSMVNQTLEPEHAGH